MSDIFSGFVVDWDSTLEDKIGYVSCRIESNVWTTVNAALLIFSNSFYRYSMTFDKIFSKTYFLVRKWKLPTLQNCLRIVEVNGMSLIAHPWIFFAW